jgi:catechol 2,3-dioxygenase-like lactoylglutathione lyase family enzyme
MTEGIRTLIFPVRDLARAKTLYSNLLGVAPEDADGNVIGLVQSP